MVSKTISPSDSYLSHQKYDFEPCYSSIYPQYDDEWLFIKNNPKCYIQSHRTFFSKRCPYCMTYFDEDSQNYHLHVIQCFLKENPIKKRRLNDFIADTNSIQEKEKEILFNKSCYPCNYYFNDDFYPNSIITASIAPDPTTDDSILIDNEQIILGKILGQSNSRDCTNVKKSEINIPALVISEEDINAHIMNQQIENIRLQAKKLLPVEIRFFQKTLNLLSKTTNINSINQSHQSQLETENNKKNDFIIGMISKVTNLIYSGIDGKKSK